jgi:hypothetical protein
LLKKNSGSVLMQNEDDSVTRLQSKFVNLLEQGNIDVVVYEQIEWHMKRGMTLNLRFLKSDIDLCDEMTLDTLFGQRKPVTVHLVVWGAPPLHVNVLMWYSYQKVE